MLCPQYLTHHWFARPAVCASRYHSVLRKTWGAVTHDPRREIGRLAYIPLPVTLKNTVFWFVTPSSLTKIYENFRRSCQIHLRGVKSFISHLILNKNLEAVDPSKISVNLYLTTRLNIKNDIFHSPNLNHSAVHVLSKTEIALCYWSTANSTSLGAFAYEKRLLVSLYLSVNWSIRS